MDLEQAVLGEPEEFPGASVARCTPENAARSAGSLEPADMVQRPFQIDDEGLGEVRASRVQDEPREDLLDVALGPRRVAPAAGGAHDRLDRFFRTCSSSSIFRRIRSKNWGPPRRVRPLSRPSRSSSSTRRSACRRASSRIGSVKYLLDDPYSAARSATYSHCLALRSSWIRNGLGYFFTGPTLPPARRPCQSATEGPARSHRGARTREWTHDFAILRAGDQGADALAVEDNEGTSTRGPSERVGSGWMDRFARDGPPRVGTRWRRDIRPGRGVDRPRMHRPIPLILRRQSGRSARSKCSTPLAS